MVAKIESWPASKVRVTGREADSPRTAAHQAAGGRRERAVRSVPARPRHEASAHLKVPASGPDIGTVPTLALRPPKAPRAPAPFRPSCRAHLKAPRAGLTEAPFQLLCCAPSSSLLRPGDKEARELEEGAVSARPGTWTEQKREKKKTRQADPWSGHCWQHRTSHWPRIHPKNRAENWTPG